MTGASETPVIYRTYAHLLEALQGLSSFSR
jgi:hypothetical protein